MKMSKVFVLTGLGWGDEGKGTITHWLSHLNAAHTVVRTGGPQAFHTVVDSKGRSIQHSQFGSGTFVGARTHLSSNMIVHPYAVLNEGRGLMKLGVANAFDLMTIDEDCLVITPFQELANRLLEISRGKNRLGTVGRGVGETVIDSETRGEDFTVRVKDIGKPCLREKLENIRELKLKQVKLAIGGMKKMSKKAHRNFELLCDSNLIKEVLSEFEYMVEMVKVVDGSYLGEILKKSGTVIFEPSQGVLLDRWHGFHPYVTKARPEPEAALELLKLHNYQGEIIRYGILRSYHTRHGAGPFVTEDAELSKILADPHNTYNNMQGNFRVGHFDTVAARYAVNVCGGAENLDGIIITCLDQIKEMPIWQICNNYVFDDRVDEANGFFFQKDGVIEDIIVRGNTRDEAQIEHQQKLGELLTRCRPKLTGCFSDPFVFLKTIRKQISIPIVAGSSGLTEKDKMFINV
jgi:adenylosuccinate synthase